METTECKFNEAAINYAIEETKTEKELSAGLWILYALFPIFGFISWRNNKGTEIGKSSIIAALLGMFLGAIINTI